LFAKLFEKSKYSNHVAEGLVMESHKDIFVRHNKLLKSLSNLPEKILEAHHHEKLTELVLYELSHPDCFNFSKAAYFINNPDFNHFHGITGYAKNEHPVHNSKNIWEQPDTLHNAMDNSAFHKKVRDIKRDCIGKNCIELDLEKRNNTIKCLGEELHFINPSHVFWKTKHDNHALLLFEHEDTSIQEEYSQDLLRNVSLLGFCGIY
jgi:hypothetical protein